jgi:phosphate transport system protein
MSKLSTPGMQFNEIKESLEKLAGAVLAQMRSLRDAAATLKEDELMAIVERDKEIDKLELSVDRIAKSFMELRAPVGPDFRYMIGALDISRNLERIGDCIEYVARHISEASTMPKEFPDGWDIVERTIDKCHEILEMANTSWIKSDAKLARRIPEQDDFVDALQDSAYSAVIKGVRAGKVDVELGMQTMLIINKLEALADIACHIAESVVFMIVAQQIRHEKPTTPDATEKLP